MGPPLKQTNQARLSPCLPLGYTVFRLRLAHRCWRQGQCNLAVACPRLIRMASCIMASSDASTPCCPQTGLTAPGACGRTCAVETLARGSNTCVTMLQRGQDTAGAFPGISSVHLQPTHEICLTPGPPLDVMGECTVWHCGHATAVLPVDEKKAPHRQAIRRFGVSQTLQAVESQAKADFIASHAQMCITPISVGFSRVTLFETRIFCA